MAERSRQTCMSSEGVNVREGFHPIPDKLANKIRAGECMDMEELLPEVWTLGEEGEPKSKRRCSRKITNIFTWLQYFGVNVSICRVQFPGLIPEFMVYMSLIVRVSKRIHGNGIVEL